MNHTQRVIDAIFDYLVSEMHNQRGAVHFQRKFLAEKFDCSKSQINYVLEKKFKDNEQFVLTVLRGSGGGITIRWSSGFEKMDVWDKEKCKFFIHNLFFCAKITSREKDIMLRGIEQCQSLEDCRRMTEDWLYFYQHQS